MNGHKKMSLCVCYESAVSGETIAAEEIVKAFARFQNTSVASFAKEPIGDTRIARYFYWITTSVASWLGALLKNRTTDWVYVTTYTAGVAAVILKRFGGYRIAFHYHGRRLPERPASIFFFTQWLKFRIVWFLHAFFLTHTERIIVPSESAREELRRDFPFLCARIIGVVPNGVDAAVFHLASQKQRERLRKKHGVPAVANVVAYIGRIHEEKGIELFLRSVARMRDVPGLVLVIAHHSLRREEHVYHKRLQKLARELKLGARLRWVVDPTCISDIYAIADVVVLPSRHDHFPLVMLEALAAGVPFLGSSVGVMPEILSKIDQRLVLDDWESARVAERIREILLWPQKKRKNFVRKARNLARDYSWEETVTRVIDLLGAPRPKHP